ncbi:hypothetical protein PCPL58_3693 [Pseudomonas cerasi]|uniref:Uncharacterized protein n=1 Tax=Pseudomonas cerasi TaxID=1583341 RepID=A0A193SSU8_9PSED|nr:hypothetical protein PCPL58_3693 [Pseudomonas cerasi]SOS21870.1 hypothetical protein PL963_03783 [Pseudomonas cerasi]
MPSEKAALLPMISCAVSTVPIGADGVWRELRAPLSATSGTAAWAFNKRANVLGRVAETGRGNAHLVIRWIELAGFDGHLWTSLRTHDGCPSNPGKLIMPSRVKPRCKGTALQSVKLLRGLPLVSCSHVFAEKRFMAISYHRQRIVTLARLQKSRPHPCYGVRFFTIRVDVPGLMPSPLFGAKCASVVHAVHLCWICSKLSSSSFGRILHVSTAYHPQ